MSVMDYAKRIKVKQAVNQLNSLKSRFTPVAKVAPELKQSTDTKPEISKTCAVLGCEDSKILSEQYFFRFPENPHLRQIWTDLTGRNNWTPTDYSYVCIQHFSMDSFVDDTDILYLKNDAVPSQKLPKHVLEVEYIDEDSLDNEESKSENLSVKDEKEGDAEYLQDEYETEWLNEEEPPKINTPTEVDVLKLFTEVQNLQRTTVTLRNKLKTNLSKYNRQNRKLQRLEQVIDLKKNILKQRKNRKSRILLSIQDRIKEDTSGLVLAMPTKHTEDLKNFSLSIYKYSPQAYVYLRNTLRTMLPSTHVLEGWIKSGFQPKNVLLNNNMIKLVAEQTDTELSCKVSLV